MLESDVRGFHVYRPAWNPVLGEELTAEREPGNSEDPFAVRLKRGGETVGHVPREIHCKTADTHSAFSHACARSGHFYHNSSWFYIIIRVSNNSRYYDLEEQNLI